MSLLFHLRRRGYTIWRTGSKSFELVPEPPESLMAKVKARGKDILEEILAEEFAAEQKIARLQHQVRSGRMEPAEAEELMTYLARQTTAATAPPDAEACSCGETLLWRYRGEGESLPLICYSCHPPLPADSAWNIECFTVFAEADEAKEAA